MPKMPARRKQPARQSSQKSTDNLLGQVLDELCQLKEEVNALKGDKANTSKQDVADLLAGTSGRHDTDLLQTQAAMPEGLSAVPDIHPPVSPHLAPQTQQQAQAHVSVLPSCSNVAVATAQGAYPTETVSRPTIPLPSSSLPATDIVPENVRKDILRGKDVNLCQLLIPARERGSFVAGREIRIGEETLALRPFSDKRMSKLLTIQEFVKAFNMYKNIICEVFPDRRAELDRYMTNIIDISAKYQGFAHYEYHLEFAARAAFFKEHKNILIDWGCLDDRLITQIVAGRKASTCALCGAFDHSSTFCHLAAEGQVKPGGASHKGATCQYYNMPGGCKKFPCPYAHRCGFCASPGHPAVKCELKRKGGAV